MTAKYALLNQGEDNEMEVFGYKTVRWQQVLCIIGYIFSLGFLRVLFYWKPQLDVWCQCIPCSFSQADVILLRTTDDHREFSKKKVIEISPRTQGSKSDHQTITKKNSIIDKSLMKPMGKIRYIEAQKIRYVWNTVEGKFQKIGILEEDLSCSDIHSKFGSGLTAEEQEIRQQVCGLNSIEVEIKPIWIILIKEIFNPFYVFQVYSLSIWMWCAYVEYSCVILAMSILSIIATVYNLRVQSVKLHKMSISYNSIMVTVLRKNGELKEVESQTLVPGDVIILYISENKHFLPCDAILINGACTVNEGMLTGESTPVSKVPLPRIESSMPWKMQCGEDYKRHVLFCGTEVIQIKAYGQDLVKAVVIQTGFNTTKGDLVRAILYNKPMNVKLHREAMRFLLVLVFISLLGVAYSAAVFKKNGASVHEIVMMSLLILTLAVNATLPASLTLGLLYGQTRLKKLGIFCISPQRIILAGQLNLVCFDKTGTLTEDSLDLHGVLPSNGTSFQDIHLFSSAKTMPWSPLLGAMASCHSLIMEDGKMQGDPLDLKMFEGTGWEFESHAAQGTKDGESNSYTMVKPGPSAGEVPVEGIAVLHQLPFSSSLQRMSVITQILGERDFTVFMKGAPEMVIRFCKPETVPHNISKKLDYYTTQGFRVIGLAYRLLQKEGIPAIEDLKWDIIETDLIFLGLLILENRLKPETITVLQELSTAKIRNVMVTGDNLQTALNIGKHCGMIPKSSKIIIIEASEPQNDVPASITWKTITENQENEHKETSFHTVINAGWKPNTSQPEEFHFAIDGKSFQILRQHFYNIVPKVLLNGTIFARMTPKLKSSLVEEFRKLEYHVGMCGDGANDCGALKMANVGVSLSELEASVASPFTSKIPNIQCVPMLIKEGRNTLVSSFSMFKFLSVLTTVGLLSMVFLFWKQTFLSNAQYLMQDCAIVIPVCLTASLNGPAPKLAPHRPPGQLLSPSLLLSVFLHFLLSLGLQTTAYVLLQAQPWYNESDVFSACLPLNHSTENITARVPTITETYLATTTWIVTGMNIITIEFVFAKGSPFRQRLHTNYLFIIIIILQVAIFLFFLFAGFEQIYTTFEVVCIPFYWRVYILVMVLVHFVLSYAIEEGILENRKLWLLIKKLCNYQSKSQYRKLQRGLKMDTEWPPQNRTDYAIKSASVVDSKILVFKNASYQPPTENSGEFLGPQKIM
ncbi:probable cation-transporting ATPase 13A4 isoform X2 [Xenopus laevis]|uniref:Cation-transporting ATPase n=1 Tax=Xenopus laevis TaxID=8355 RepID=A0A8J1KR25_XENLA|nr:probable cation-transporting ATPase 13A4 isoform X2 [Xenopus laevis]